MTPEERVEQENERVRSLLPEAQRVLGSSPDEIAYA